MSMQGKISVIILGAGGRGTIYANLIKLMPEKAEVVAVAEPRDFFRNRIVAGMTRATIVTEAGIGSGALITAKLALDNGREVFAVPGHADNMQAKGCHKLIKEGAALIETFGDVLDAFGVRVGGYLPGFEPDEVGEGSVNSASISVRSIVEVALNTRATTVVLAHNHPSGVAVPSVEDVQTTRRIAAALQAVEVHLADHIVVSEGDYVSMVQSGYRFDVPMLP